MRWAAERGEEFLAASHGRDVVTHAELALDADGKVLGYRVRSLADVGAYAGTTGIIIQLLIGPWVSTSIYDIRTIDFQFDAVLTPHAADRRLSRRRTTRGDLSDRAPVRRRRARRPASTPSRSAAAISIAAAQMPYTNAMGQVYDSGDFEAVLDAGLQGRRLDAAFAAREAQSQARGKLRGRGFASFLEWTGGNAFEERVTCAVKAEGEIEVYATTMPMGQGIATSYAQLVVDTFGVDIAKVKVVTGDSDRGSGFGSAGSRSLFTAGSAIDAASQTDGATRRANSPPMRWKRRRPTSNMREGEFRVAGTDRAIELFELAAQAAGAPHLRGFHNQGRRARAGRTAATSARSRSIPRPARSRSSPTPPPTTSAASSIR